MRKPRLSPFAAGAITLVAVVVVTYFGWTLTNPFAQPFTLRAVFRDSVGVRERAPVRIAGVEVGKVTKVEPVAGRSGAAAIEMEIEDEGLPIHADAVLKLRPRIFLEGNFFVDLHPGSPSAATVQDGHTIPVSQTAAPVLAGDALTLLQSDVRRDYQTFLEELAKGLDRGGAEDVNASIRYWAGAYRDLALTNDAALGGQRDRDLQRVLRGHGRTVAALGRNAETVRRLVGNLATTANALAREDAALEASVPALRDALRTGMPALASLNDALPSLRGFARDALPGVRSSVPTADAAIPFLAESRRLVSVRELRGLAGVLRRRLPTLVRLGEQGVGVLGEARQLSACMNEVLVPFIRSRFPNVAENPPHDGEDIRDQQVRFQIQRGFPGLAGESRLADGNGFAFHGMGVPNPTQVQPAPPSDIDRLPARRPDVPCETQEPPNLEAPVAPVTAFAADASARTRFDPRALLRAESFIRDWDRLLARLPTKERRR